MTLRLHARAHSTRTSRRHPKRRPYLVILGAIGLATYLAMQLARKYTLVVRTSPTSDPSSFVGLGTGTEVRGLSDYSGVSHGHEMKSLTAQTLSRRQGKDSDFDRDAVDVTGGAGGTRGGHAGPALSRMDTWDPAWKIAVPVSPDEWRATSGNGGTLGPGVEAPSRATGGPFYPKLERAERVGKIPLRSTQDGKTHLNMRTTSPIDDSRSIEAHSYTSRSPGLRGERYASKPTNDGSESRARFRSSGVHVSPSDIALSGKPPKNSEGAAAGHGEAEVDEQVRWSDDGHFQNAAGGNGSPLENNISVGIGQYSRRDTTKAAGSGEKEYGRKFMGKDIRNNSRMAGATPGSHVPKWVWPSTEELKQIIEDQFGHWRTMDDTVARPSSILGQRKSSKDALGGDFKSEAGTEQARAHCEQMHQGMDPFRDRDLRDCYDRLRQDFVFGEPLRQIEVVTLGGGRTTKRSPSGVVAFMSTSLPSDIKDLMSALRHLSSNFLRRNRYPVAVIHEDFTRDVMERLQGLVPVPIHFLRVEFKLPDWMEPLSWIYPLAAKHFTGHPKSTPAVKYHSEMRGLLPYVKRNSFGYFHMCRFFSGAGFMLPFFDDFEFYMRLDSESTCRQIMPDYFQQLEVKDHKEDFATNDNLWTWDAGADYAFDSTVLDYGEKVQGLWNFAEKYIITNNIEPTFWDSPDGAGKQFAALGQARARAPYPNCNNQPLTDEPVVNVGGADIHTVPCNTGHFQAMPAFYTNFEVARLKMLRSTWYQEWFTAVDKTGSIFFNRWGDAPVRFTGLAMHLPAEKIVRVRGCTHP